MSNLHPQTRSFLEVFPVPSNNPAIEGRLALLFDELWLKTREANPALPSFTGLKASAPGFNHNEAEKFGNDYRCDITACFDGNVSIFLGTIYYPDDNGEFVMKGHRYFIPMYLRNSYQVEKSGREEKKTDSISLSEETEKEDYTQCRDTDDLSVVLIGDVLYEGLKGLLTWVLKKVEKNYIDLKSKSGSMETILHAEIKKITKRFFRKEGRLVETHNPLSRICQRREVTFYGTGGVHPESVGHERLRDVNEKDIYRICPVQTPQGHVVGLRLYLARGADVDIANKKITPPANPVPGDSLGDAASLIPFIEHDGVGRALMGANMMKQALALQKPEAPLVQTGWERVTACQPEVPEFFKQDGVLALGTNLLVGYIPWGLDTFEDGIVVSQSAADALASVEEKTFWFNEKKEFVDGKCWIQEASADNPELDEDILGKLDERGIVKVGQEVRPGDVLVSAILKRSKGINKTKIIDAIWKTLTGAEPEELQDNSLRLPHNFRGTVSEIITLSDSDKRSKTLPRGMTRRIGVRVQRKEPLAVGDKLTGRHGNKGVVARILPNREMPYMKVEANACNDKECKVNGHHRHLQVILSPLGVIGRMNPGQIYETALAKVAERNGKSCIVRPFIDKWSPERLSEELSSNGFSPDGKEQLYILNGDAEQPLQNRSLAGPQYILRLYHRAPDKIHSRGKGSASEYSSRDQQPLPGQRMKGGTWLKGGQRLGEMETWALAAHSAWHLLDDFLTVKSDDRVLRKEINNPLFKWDAKRRPDAFVNLILASRGLGLNLELWDEKGKNVTRQFLEEPRGIEFSRISLDLATDEAVKEWGLNGEVRSILMYATETAGKLRSIELEAESRPQVEFERNGLFSRVIFNRPWDMGQISLSHSIVHPLAAWALLKAYYYPQRFSEKKKREIPLTIWADLYDRIKDSDWPEINMVDDDSKGAALYFDKLNKDLKSLKGKGRRPCDYIISTVPVVPPNFRRERKSRRREFENELNFLYLEAITYNSTLRILQENKAPDAILKDGRSRLFMAIDRLYRGGVKSDGEKIKGLVGVLKGKQGLLRGHLAGKRADYSGRAVIVGDHTVPLDEVYLPQDIWSEVFPHALRQDTKPIVLLNRQPSLHRYSIQAFKASPHSNGKVLRINPFVCKPFNADFDGDTMAVHVPKKPQAIGEAERLLPSQNLFSQANGGLVLGFGGDLAVGVVYLSYHPTIQTDDEVPLTSEGPLRLDNHNFREERIVNKVRTTVGRLLLRRVFGDVPIPNRDMDPKEKEGVWKKGLEAVAGKGASEATSFTGKLSKLVADTLMVSGLSLSIADIDSAGKREEVKSDAPSLLWILLQAGAKGNLKPLTEPLGEMSQPGRKEKSESIKSGLLAGLTESDYLLSAHGARSGLIDKGLSTAHAGTLLRKLVYKLQDVYIVCEDCRTAEGLEAKEFPEYRLIGRESSGGSFLSPYKCKAADKFGRWGICQRCYGQDPATGHFPKIGLPVGLLAAQAVGERGSQLALRTFHKADKAKDDLDLDLLSEKIFKSGVESEESAVKWLKDMMTMFEKQPDPPRQIHLEVILRGVKNNLSEGNLLSDITYSSVGQNLLYGAAGCAEDKLSGVISRIVSGSSINTAPGEE